MQTTVSQLIEPEKNRTVGITSGVAYDTAWTARVTDGNGNPLFPECIRWLLENQRPDGSWGSGTPNYHDRLLSTLSVIVALKETGGRQYEGAIQQGEAYIWENLKKLELESRRFIGSELLFPSLMEEAESLGLNLPYNVRIYQREYNAKLQKVDESLWYTPFTTLSYSLEFLGDRVDANRLMNVKLPNGSVATSPAATAFFLRHTKDMDAYMYLKKILQLTGNGSIMTVYPIEVFEYGWSIYNLMLAGLYFEQYNEICSFLLKSLGDSGVGWSVELPVADADDTALACMALAGMGYPIDFRIFDEYDTGNYYIAFNFELDPSTSTNIHVLDLAQKSPGFPNRDEVTEKIARFLRREMHPEGFWVDKWHISPYYTTSHAIVALCDVDRSLAEKAISWLLKSQNDNGLWGGNGGTLEETSYVVQALMCYHKHVEHIDLRSVFRAISAMDFDKFSILTANLAELWMGKVLYTPVRVAWSSIASAQFMGRAGTLEMSASGVS